MEIESLRTVVREAGEISLQHFGCVRDSVEFKSAADLVTHVDRAVEDFLRERLAVAFPGVGFLGEESGGERPTGRYFVVDPIDGTTSFVHGIPFYSVSVALKEDRSTLAGVVFAPALGDLYCATRGGGAWKNGQRIRVSETDRLINALAATGFACVRQRKTPNNLPLFCHLVERLRGVRRLGSSAVDLCLVAEGTLDFYWEMNIMPWDIAAGVLILREAGGTVTDFEGGDRSEETHEIVATNGLLHEAFMRELATVSAQPNAS